MFNKPIFETLPIAVIAGSILFILLLHTVAASVFGSLLIMGACFVLYRRLIELGTDPDVMDYTDGSEQGL